MKPLITLFFLAFSLPLAAQTTITHGYDDAGNRVVRSSSNRTIAGNAFMLLSRFTLELPQTLLGNSVSHVRNISGNVDNVEYYGGATLVNHNKPNEDLWGFTLGPYINSQNVMADPVRDDLFRHEYGHTLQSRIFGPLYLYSVALPSLISEVFDNQHGIIPTSHHHDDSWFETEANRLSYRYLNHHENGALNRVSGGHPWNDKEYHRDYRTDWFWFLIIL